MLNFRSLGLLSSLVVVTLLTRFLPHPPNFTAVGALAIFSGFYIRPRALGLIFPLGLLLFTDLVIGFHNTMLFTYGAWLVLALVAGLTLKHFSWAKLAVISGGGAFWFFAVSNFGVWLTGGLYPQTSIGLAECFVAALPFLGNQLLGDLFFTALMFATWQFAERRVPALRPIS